MAITLYESSSSRDENEADEMMDDLELEDIDGFRLTIYI